MSALDKWCAAALVGIVLLILGGCAGTLAHREGLRLLAEGQTDAGLAKLEEAVKADPDNAQFRSELYSRKADTINRTLAAGHSERLNGRYDAAEVLFSRVQQIEPGNDKAKEGLAAVTLDRKHAPMITEARELLKKGEPDKARLTLRTVQTENPNNPDYLELKRQIDELVAKRDILDPGLRPFYDKPISLEFKEANLKNVLEALSRSTGVNFILDKDVRADLRTTVYLKQASLEDAIDLILQTNQLQKKVLNRNTILIYANTPEKIKEYQELVVKAFYLATADVKQVQNTLKTLLKSKDVVIDEKLNILMMRDTPEAIRLAEKIIALQDLSEPEVMLEVEVLEVKRTRLLELGVQFPNQLTFTPLNTAGSSDLVLSDLKGLNSDRIGVSTPSTTLNMRRDVSDANLLANPRIRAKNREKAKILIGDRVPVITTTTTSTGFVSESVQYLDVGLKLDVEPTIYLKDQVAIKIGLEVSSLVKEVRSSTGSLSYQVGTRTASTTLQLKDGETQILAGLINNEDRTSASRLPGLGDLPVLGRLFSSQKDDYQKTEIVLSITPRIVRNLDRPDAVAGEFWSGTEAVLRTKPVTLPLQQLKDESAGNSPGSVAGANLVAGPGISTSSLTNMPIPGTMTDPTTVSLSWQAPATVKVGENFKLVLHVKTDGGLRSLPFQASFDSTVFQVMEVKEGEFFKQGGAESNFSSNVDVAAGRMFIGAGRSGVDGAKGEKSVVVMTLKALSPKAPSDIRLLTAQPITVGQKTMQPTLPPPLSITVTN